MRQLTAIFARARIVAPFLLAMALAAGCKLNTPAPATGCVSDNQCDPGYACANGACLPRASRGTWAIELLPTNESSAAQTQLASVSFSDQSDNKLTADSKATITGDLQQGSSLAGDSHVIAIVQTPIPGHDDLQFESDWLTPPGVGTPPPFSLSVPMGTIGNDVTFQIIPLTPRDQAQAPITWQTKLSTANALPAKDGMYNYVSGTLVTPDLNLGGGFVARAFSGGQLVSSVGTVNNSDGTFRIQIFQEVAQPITVEIAPSSSQYSTPRFTTGPITLPSGFDHEVKLANSNLPAIGFATLFRFQVAGPDGKPVLRAIVRAHTVLSSDDNGSSDLVRDGTTDVNGNVDLALLPGSNGGVQSYDVSVIPPSGSAFGIACLNAVAIAGSPNPGASGSPPVAAQLSLPNKLTLSGKILSADGVVVPGVAIAATRTAVDPTTNCDSSIASSPASASSNPDGTFQLMVDPGTYRLDFDPPAGSAVPRLTETGVVVTAGTNATHPIRMLAGEVVNGIVQDATGARLSSVDVKFFEVDCSGSIACYGPMRIAPILRAETHTGSDGTFRAVVPVQLPSP
jgi:hypothetical protein